jgi:hypothetical protein
MRYVFSLRVLKQMDAHTHAAFINYFTHTRACIHSFFFFLIRGKTMFFQDQILINPKSSGLVHDVCVKIASEQRATDFKAGISWFVAEMFSETAK